MGLNIEFYNSTMRPIPDSLIVDFETKYLKNHFGDLNLRVTDVFSHLGPIMVDHMDTMEWGKEIPDIHSKSSRLFSVWGQDSKTNEVVVILRGFFVVVPFNLEVTTYYQHSEDLYYPIAQISSIRTIYTEEKVLDELIQYIYMEINETWKSMRIKTINHLNPNSSMWKRFVASVDKVIQYTFVCHSMDRELIMAFKRHKYQPSAVYQIMSSLDASYDEVLLKEHLKKSLKIIREAEDTAK